MLRGRDSCRVLCVLCVLCVVGVMHSLKCRDSCRVSPGCDAFAQVSTLYSCETPLSQSHSRSRHGHCLSILYVSFAACLHCLCEWCIHEHVDSHQDCHISHTQNMWILTIYIYIYIHIFMYGHSPSLSTVWRGTNGVDYHISQDFWLSSVCPPPPRWRPSFGAQ